MRGGILHICVIKRIAHRKIDFTRSQVAAKPYYFLFSSSVQFMNDWFCKLDQPDFMIAIAEVKISNALLQF